MKPTRSLEQGPGRCVAATIDDGHDIPVGCVSTTNGADSWGDPQIYPINADFAKSDIIGRFVTIFVTISERSGSRMVTYDTQHIAVAQEEQDK